MTHGANDVGRNLAVLVEQTLFTCINSDHRHKRRSSSSLNISAVLIYGRWTRQALYVHMMQHWGVFM